MIDDQVNAEELAERKSQREAAQNATDDGMPITPALEAVDDEAGKYRTAKQWGRHARKWLGVRGAMKQS